MKIALIAEKTETSGSGHISRMQALKDGLEYLGFKPELHILETYEEIEADMIIVDSYNFKHDHMNMTDELALQFIPLRKAFWKLPKLPRFRKETDIREVTGKTAKQMRNLMLTSKFVMTNSGVSLLEAVVCCERVYAFIAADNQRKNYDWYRVIKRNGNKNFKEIGSIKLAKHFLHEYLKEHFTLRDAYYRDSLNVWKLRNDKTVRKMSHNTKRISLASHDEWFNNRVRKSDPFFIVECKGDFVGYVRYEKGKEISIAINKKYRCGVGSDIIKRSLEKVDTGYYHAFINPTNIKSIEMFKKAGFEETTGIIQFEIDKKLRYTWRRG